MNKIEFKTKVENGVIEIPKIYKDFMSGELRIIAVKDENNLSEISKEERLRKLEEFDNVIEKYKDLKFEDDIDIDKLINDINEVKL